MVGAGRSIQYGNQAVGINKLKGLMKEIAEKAGLHGNYTNLSLNNYMLGVKWTGGISVVK